VSPKHFTSSLISEAKKYEGKVSWQSPSNIALIKYWGKFGVQLPKNSSLSFALSEAYTYTSILYTSKINEKAEHEFFFKGKENPAFSKKVLHFLKELDVIFPFLKQLDIKIESKNSFPHSAGIASSASSMSALALCLCSIEQELIGSLQDEIDFFTKASYVARLGSGSASRSVYGGYSVWGEFTELVETSNDYAVPFTYEVHPLFMLLRDSILIVSDTEKAVSSRAGHALMNGHPYADARIAQSKQNMSCLIAALKQGDTDLFIEVVENEAMSLHALMMSSKPWYSLLHPNTLMILDKIRAFREKNGLFICFTLDAGPNVHLLYTEEDESQVMQFIDNDLIEYCVDRNIIHDKVGFGPKRME
jgi:diphosphomevalonate decarboxylase